VRQVLSKSELLAEFPGIGADRGELGPGVRSFPLGNYVLYFKRIDNGIELLRVLHGARRLPEAFNDAD
jgi:toxin ParE1/3/4